MTKKEKIIKYYYDKNNWVPPSFQSVANKFGIKSKSYIHSIIRQSKKSVL